MKLGRYIVGLLSGLTFGLLFAPKKGKDVRLDLAKSHKENPKDVLKVLGKVYKSAWDDAYDEIKHLSESEQVEAFLELSKDRIRDFLDNAEGKGTDFAAKAQEKLEDFSAFAQEKANELKGAAKKTVAKKVTKKVTKAKAKVKANVKASVKKAKTKVAKARKLG